MRARRRTIRRTGRYGGVPALGALALVVGAAGCTGSAGRAPGPRPSPSDSPRVESSVIELGDQPYAIDAGGGSVWVSGARDHLLEVRGRDVFSRPHPTGPLGIAVADGIVWTTSPSGESNPVSEVIGFDARTRDVADRVSLSRESPYGIDADGGAVYVALYDGALLRIDARTHDETRVELGEGLTQVLAAHGLVWVSQPGAGVLWRVELDRRRAIPISFRDGGSRSCPQGTDATGASVLVADPCAGKVWLVDRRGRKKTELTDVGARPVDVAVGGGLAYVVSMRDDKVTVLNVKTLRAVADTTAGEGAISVAVRDGVAWVANAEDYSITKLAVRGPRP